MDGKLVLELSEALRKSGLYPGPAVFNFLTAKGYSSDDIMRSGGWMPLLLQLISDEYGTVESLVAAIEGVKK